MNSNKKKNLLQRAAALTLLLAFAQSSISAYDPYAQYIPKSGQKSSQPVQQISQPVQKTSQPVQQVNTRQEEFVSAAASFRGSAQTNTISDMYTSDTALDMSTTQLNSSARITNSTAKISLSLRDSDLQQVLRMFADKAGLNIVFHESMHAAEAAGGQAAVPKQVTMDLVDTSINDAFMLVLEATGLSYYLDNKTIIIAPRDSIAKISLARQNLTSLPVHYVDAKSIADFLNTNVYSSNIPGLSSQHIATVNPRTNELMIFGSRSDVEVARKIIAKLDTKPMINTFIVNHTTPKEMAMLICASIVGPDGGKGGKGGSGNGEGAALNFSMAPSKPFKGVMTGAAGGLDEVTLGGGEIACSAASISPGSGASSSGPGGPSALSSYSGAPMSVAYFPQLGKVSIYGGSVKQVEAIKEFVAANDKKQLMAFLEMSIVELNEKGSKELNNVWQMNTPFASIGFDGVSTGTGAQSMTLFDGAARGSRRVLPRVDSASGDSIFKEVQRWYPPEITYQDGVRTINQGEWVTDFLNVTNNPLKLKYGVNLAIANGNGRMLANPKIMITNGKTSVIDLQEDYVKTVKTEFSSQSTGLTSTPIVTRTFEIGDDAGIKVEMTPFISLDGYVTLNVKPDYATIKERVMAPVSIGGTTAMELAATLLQKRNMELNNIRIKDGETLVIGGLIKEQEIQTTSKVPVLGDLPLIGVFFRSSTNIKEKAELVIMITPHIIYDDEQLANVKRERL